VPQYAIVNAKTGEIVRVVGLPEALPPGLICVPLPDVAGVDDSWAQLPARHPDPGHATPAAEAPARHAFSRQSHTDAILARLAAASPQDHFSLLVFEIHESERGRAEPVVQAALRVLASALGADDGVGVLSDGVIGVVLDHADASAAQSVSARLQRNLSHLPGGWTARCLSYPADRAQIERLRAAQ
jgi:hypothetical protein